MRFENPSRWLNRRVRFNYRSGTTWPETRLETFYDADGARYEVPTFDAFAALIWRVVDVGVVEVTGIVDSMSVGVYATASPGLRIRGFGVVPLSECVLVDDDPLPPDPENGPQPVAFACPVVPCPHCGGPLEVVFKADEIEAAAARDRLLEGFPRHRSWLADAVADFADRYAAIPGAAMIRPHDPQGDPS